jgi:radical SAM-linked protein
MRLLARTLRRADLPLAVTRGYSPKPRMTFSPALSLGVPSLGEYVEMDLEHGPAHGTTAALTAAEVQARLGAVCPAGIEIVACEIVPPGAPGLGRLIVASDLAILPAPDGMAFDGARVARIARAFMAQPEVVIARGDKQIDVRGFVETVDVIEGDAAAKLCGALDWPVGAALFRVRVKLSALGSAKPIEVAKALGVHGPDDPRATHALIARLGLVGVEPVAVGQGIDAAVIAAQAGGDARDAPIAQA